jgi:hypothetical protein
MNGLLHEARRAAKIERLEESVYTDDGSSDGDDSGEDEDGEDSGTEEVSEDEFDLGWPKPVWSGGIEEEQHGEGG